MRHQIEITVDTTDKGNEIRALLKMGMSRDEVHRAMLDEYTDRSRLRDHRRPVSSKGAECNDEQ